MDLDSALGDKPAEGASATDILRADHREIERLFGDYAQARSDAQTRAVVMRTVCMKLELHDELERAVFYPALMQSVRGGVNDAVHAHDEIMRIVCALRDENDCGGACDQAMSRLENLVTTHVREEEETLFPRAEDAGDAWLRELGVSMIERKEALTGSTRELEGPAT